MLFKSHFSKLSWLLSVIVISSSVGSLCCACEDGEGGSRSGNYASLLPDLGPSDEEFNAAQQVIANFLGSNKICLESAYYLSVDNLHKSSCGLRGQLDVFRSRPEGCQSILKYFSKERAKQKFDPQSIAYLEMGLAAEGLEKQDLAISHYVTAAASGGEAIYRLAKIYLASGKRSLAESYFACFEREVSCTYFNYYPFARPYLGNLATEAIEFNKIVRDKKNREGLEHGLLVERRRAHQPHVDINEAMNFVDFEGVLAGKKKDEDMNLGLFCVQSWVLRLTFF